ncbi:Gfo/Idh/MocA family oxidoreductase [Microbacterium sp. 1P10UB]|uniref:Gfo/Idh/MocA family protein n=1 Tax=unclassified Microbacterium TaxID=2609290 RepID=UPI0039A3C674
MSVIRTGLIGFGSSGRVFHAPFLAADPAYSLDVIVTADAGRSGEARALYPDAATVASVDDLFTGDLDLVVIGSPPATHHELATRAIEAGIAVVVDKPFAPTAAEARDLIDRATAAGVPLTVFQNRRWDGDFLALRGLLADGALGEVRRFESRFEWFKPVEAKAWKIVGPGSGMLFDLGTHLIDQALQLFGPVESHYAELDVRRDGGGSEDDVFVALRHDSGVTSHLWMNALAPLNGPRYHVLGSSAGWTSHGLDPQEASLKGGASPADAGFGGGARPGILGTTGETREIPLLPGDYAAFYRQLADTLRGDGELPVDPRDALAVLELIERLRAH